jgi:hypothetical protein
MDNAVSWFSRDHATGSIAYGGLVKDGVDGVDGLEYATSVAVCPTGNYVYATARIDEALTWYVREPSTGELTFGGAFTDDGGVVDVLGQAASVAVSPDGRHVYAVGADRAVSCFEMQDGNGIQLFDGIGISGSFQLGQNSPNPFNAMTGIKYRLRNAGRVNLFVYDIRGRLIKKVLDNRFHSYGYFTVTWNGRDHSGRDVCPGIYVYRMTTGRFTKTRRMMLVK